jgi:hypothetical protein
MSEFVIVEHAGNEAVAEIMRQRLGEAGIPCLVAPTNLAAVAGASATFAVSVPPDQVEAAREVLA